VAVIGAGGVARAITAGFVDSGAKVTVYNRTASRGEKLAAEFGCEFIPLGDLSSGGTIEARLLVNCTSVGMFPEIARSPVPAGCFSGNIMVFDTVYNPVETRLLKEARAAGARTVDGLAMFVNQALAQYRLFTGREGDAATMAKAMKSWIDT
jgi:shikimate 5-dehydrogenase